MNSFPTCPEYASNTCNWTLSEQQSIDQRRSHRIQEKYDLVGKWTHAIQSFFCFKIMTELQSIIPAFRSYHRHSVSDWSFGQHIWFLQYVLPLPKVLAVLHSSFDVCHLAMLVRYCYKKCISSISVKVVLVRYHVWFTLPLLLQLHVLTVNAPKKDNIRYESRLTKSHLWTNYLWFINEYVIRCSSCTLRSIH